MAIHVGTSGYNYTEWRGIFYPEKFPTTKMFEYYAERLDSVEINYTYYHMPAEKVVDNWAAAAPEGFTYCVKAPGQITYRMRFQNCEPPLELFIARSNRLGMKLGALLFLVPPYFKKDERNLETLAKFLTMLPPGTRAAFEFRHDSWLAEDVYETLRKRNAALCIADSERFIHTPVVPTADFGYFRLRNDAYSEAEVRGWGDQVKEHIGGWKETYVYFEHEEKATGPEFARLFKSHLGLS